MTVRRLAATLGVVLAVACGPLPLPESGPYHRADATVSVMRLVHASYLVEVAGARFYVDPWLYSGVVFRQTEPLGLRPHALPPANAVLLTDRDGDRFDRRALEQIAPRTPLAIAPAALAAELRRLGFHTVRSLAAWEETQVGDVTVTAVPADDPKATGYLLRAADVRVYAAAASASAEVGGAVANAFGPVDVALLPIGGRRFFGVPQEADPEVAAQTAQRLAARRVIPIGYGRTGGQPIHWYTARPVERFREAARTAGIDDTAIVVLPPGESWHYYRPE